MGYVLAFLAAALWGMTYTLDEKVLEEFPPVKVYFLHCVVGLFISAGVWVATGGKLAELYPESSGSANRKILVASMLIGCVAGLAIVTSIVRLGASLAAILEISYPIFVLAFSWALFGKTTNWSVVLGGGLIFLGSAVIILSGHEGPKPEPAGPAVPAERPAAVDSTLESVDSSD